MNANHNTAPVTATSSEMSLDQLAAFSSSSFLSNAFGGLLGVDSAH